MLGSPRRPHTVLTRKKSTYIYTHTHWWIRCILYAKTHTTYSTCFNIDLSSIASATVRGHLYAAAPERRCWTNGAPLNPTEFTTVLGWILYKQRGFEKERLYTSWRMKESVFWPLKSHKGWGEASGLSQPPGASFWGFSMETGAEDGLDQAVFSRQIWFKS